MARQPRRVPYGRRWCGVLRPRPREPGPLRARIPAAERATSMKAIEMCGLPSRGRLLSMACRERRGRVGRRGCRLPKTRAARAQAVLHRLHECTHKLRGSYAQVGKLRARCFAPGSLPAHFVARSRRLCTRKGRRAYKLSVTAAAHAIDARSPYAAQQRIDRTMARRTLCTTIALAMAAALRPAPLSRRRTRLKATETDRHSKAHHPLRCDGHVSHRPLLHGRAHGARLRVDAGAYSKLKDQRPMRC